MKKKITKEKIVLSLRPELKKFICDESENKSEYIEFLIYKDMKKNNLIKNNIYNYDNK